MNAPDRLVADLAQRLFDDHEDGPGEVPTSACHAGLWAALKDSGLTTLADDAELSQLPELMELARQLGRTAARVPLLEALVARRAAHACGWGEWLDQAMVVRCFSAAAAGRLSGVPHAAQARSLIVIGTEQAAWFDLADAVREPGHNLADEPRDRVALPAAPRAVAACDGRALQALAAVLRTAAMAGAADRILALALEHARTREQFGRPIGAFQAVQQMLAQLAGQVALVGAAADMAAARLRPRCDEAVAAAAKIVASEAVVPINELAHQIIAAMGYTREHPLQRFTRRLWAWRDEDGSEMAWQRRLGQALLRGEEPLWHFVVDVTGQ